MSSVNGVNSTYADTAATSSASNAASKDREVSSSDFMTLLVTQLQYQDPTDPVDNQQFVAQLATFNSLDQLVSINSNVTKLAESTDTGSSSS